MYTSRFRNTGTNKAIIITLGVLLNFVLFFATTRWNLPLFLDKTGTAYAALLLGPIPALLVGFIHSLILVFFFTGPSALWFFIIHILIAVIVGISSEERVFRSISSIFGVTFIIYILNVLLNSVITLMFLGGNASDHISSVLSKALVTGGISPIISMLVSISASQLPDIIATALLTAVLYLCTPSACKK